MKAMYPMTNPDKPATDQSANHLGAAFLRGLGIVLPIALTLWLVYSLALAAENAVGGLLQQVIPSSWYWPGVGLLLSVGLIFAVGLLSRIPGMGLMVWLTQWLFERVPVIRSVYTMLRDMIDFMSASGDSGGGQPVLVTVADNIRAVGMITNSNPAELGVGGDSVLVYLPMSYQIGGYSIVVPRDRVTELDISFEDAMSYVVTAGIRQKESGSGPFPRG